MPVCVIPRSSFLPSTLRSSVRISSEGLAVFPVLRWPTGLLARLHLSLTGVGGWRPGQNLAEGHLPQEAIRRLQGVPGRWDGLYSSSEAVGQTTEKGPHLTDSMTWFSVMSCKMMVPYSSTAFSIMFWEEHIFVAVLKVRYATFLRASKQRVRALYKKTVVCRN